MPQCPHLLCLGMLSTVWSLLSNPSSGSTSFLFSMEATGLRSDWVSQKICIDNVPCKSRKIYNSFSVSLEGFCMYSIQALLTDALIQRRRLVTITSWCGWISSRLWCFGQDCRLHTCICCMHWPNLAEGQRWPSCPCLTNAVFDPVALQNASLMPV